MNAIMSNSSSYFFSSLFSSLLSLSPPGFSRITTVCIHHTTYALTRIHLVFSILPSLHYGVLRLLFFFFLHFTQEKEAKSKTKTASRSAVVWGKSCAIAIAQQIDWPFSRLIIIILHFEIIYWSENICPIKKYLDQ